LAESNRSTEPNTAEETEAKALKKQQKRGKARLRRRGPYRKSHANWWRAKS